MLEENRKRVEAFPIDRTRGISVPAHEQMAFDEMQNASNDLDQGRRVRQDSTVWRHKPNRRYQRQRLGTRRFLEAWKGEGARDKLDRCQTEVANLNEQVGNANSVATKVRMEKKLKDKEREMCKAQNALAGREAMRHSTQVIDLD